MATIAGKMQKGAAWMLLFKLAERSLGLVSLLILARLLTPEDFGLVAMAAVVIAIIELLSAFSFDMALIQNQSAERRHYDTAWTFNMFIGMFSAAALIVLANPVSQFYHEPRLVNVLMVLALGPLIHGLENIGIVAFRKELTFDREFKFQIEQKLAGFVITVSLALLFRSYWALVLGVVASRITGVILSYYLHPYRPKICLTAGRELIGFSKWLLLNNLVSLSYLHSAELIVGRVVGARAVGLYNVAFEMSNLPTTHLIAPINRAIFPGYAKVSADQTKLQEMFLKVLSVIASIALPAAFGIAAISEPLVNVVLGEKWVDAAPLIQLLAAYGAITALETNTFYIHLALGSVRTFTTLMGISLVVLVPLVITLTISTGAIGAATAYLVTSIMFFPLFYRAIMRKLDLTVRELFKCLWRPVVATAIMYAIVRQALQYVIISSAINELVGLIGLILVGASSYFVTLMGLWRLVGRPDGPEQFMLGILWGIARNPIR